MHKRKLKGSLQYFFIAFGIFILIGTFGYLAWFWIEGFIIRQSAMSGITKGTEKAAAMATSIFNNRATHFGVSVPATLNGKCLGNPPTNCAPLGQELSKFSSIGTADQLSARATQAFLFHLMGNNRPASPESITSIPSEFGRVKIKSLQCQINIPGSAGCCFTQHEKPGGAQLCVTCTAEIERTHVLFGGLWGHKGEVIIISSRAFIFQTPTGNRFDITHPGNWSKLHCSLNPNPCTPHCVTPQCPPCECIDPGSIVYDPCINCIRSFKCKPCDICEEPEKCEPGQGKYIITVYHYKLGYRLWFDASTKLALQNYFKDGPCTPDLNVQWGHPADDNLAKYIAVLGCKAGTGLYMRKEQYSDQYHNAPWKAEVVFNLGGVDKICGLGEATTPISLIWNENSKEEVSAVKFPLDPNNKGKWFRWFASKDRPLLVYDPENTKSITSPKQLFGDNTFGKKWENGYKALASLDKNKDNKISNKELKGLALWFDENQDGISQKAEIKTLKEVNIKALYYNAELNNNKLSAKLGYKRQVNGKIVKGSSIDWLSEGAFDTKEEALVGQKFVAGIGFVDMKIDPKFEGGNK